MQVSTEVVTVVVKVGGTVKDTLIFDSPTAANKWIKKQRRPDAYETITRAVRKR